MKRYRYRIITPEDVEKMKELREQGLYYKEIGKRFNVRWQVAHYHLSPREKKMSRKRTYKSLGKLTKKQIKEKIRKHQPYTNQYIKERYNNDEEFRRNFIKIVIRSRKRITKQRQKDGLCTNCGGKRDSKFIWCEKCRRKRREYEFKKGDVKNPRK